MAGAGVRSYRRAGSDVGGELGRVRLRVPAVKVEAVDVGKRTVDTGTPEDQVGTGRAEPVEVLRVVELERGIARDADPHAWSGGHDSRPPGDIAERRRNLEQTIQVERMPDGIPESTPELGR